MTPRNAPDHFRSSPMVDVGGGRALLSLSSSISNRATPQAYAQ